MRFIAGSISHDASGDHDSHETRLARGSLIDGSQSWGPPADDRRQTTSGQRHSHATLLQMTTWCVNGDGERGRVSVSSSLRAACQPIF